MDSQVINVLSIEDNPGDALLIQERLVGVEPAKWGRPQFELEWVDTLTKGLTRLSDAASGKAKRIDAVLTDLDLPDSQAGETFTILREHFPHLPIVVLTGREDEELAIQSVRAGAQDYLFKAEATSALLAHAITYAIERQQAQEALEKAHAEAEAILKERVEARTAELAKAKQFSDSLIDAMADGFSALDKDGVHIRVNPALCEMVGFSEAELIGHHPSTLYWPEEELDAIQDAFEKTARGEFKDFYLTLKRKNGERFPCIVSPSWIRDEKGEVISYFATVKDITEQKKAEEALRQSEERFRTIVNELPQFIAYTDKDLKYQFVNQTYQEKFGLKPDEVLDKPLPKVIGKKAFEKARPHVEQALRGERVRYHERYDYAIGETRDVDGILIPDIAEDGEVRGYYAVLTDITPYIAMQEAIEESEERFRMTVHRAPIGVGIVDSTGQMTDCNPTLAEMVGYTREELLHINFADFTHPDDLEREWRLIEALWEEQTTEYSIEKRYIHKDGHIIWVDVAASLFKGENKALEYCMLGIAVDITARKQTKEALEHYAIALQRSNEDLQQFAYTISHDLREPLRMVKGYLNLLTQRYRGQLDDKADQFIHFAVDGAERMETLIQDLLKYARVDTQGKALSPTDAEAILTRVLHNLHFKIVEVRAEITHDPLPTMPADETQLTQVFQNLIGNALKFSERRSNPTSQPQIHISAEAQEETWLFSVRDNGIGIAPKHQERIFGVFQRLNTREEYEGTGIGLAICKKIVERHGGQIWVESEVGEGATFYFTIPR